MFRRGNWNGYLHLICMLAFSQLIYDMSTVMVMFPGHKIEYAYIALRSMSGLWATFLTNILSFVILYTVWTLTPIPIASHLTSIRIGIFGPNTLLGILIPMTLYSSSDLAFIIVSQIYYWARILSILFNIGTYFLLVYKLNYVLKYTATATSSTRISDVMSSPKNETQSQSQQSLQSSSSPPPPSTPPRTGNPLAALVKRFKYYPIIQVLSRVGVAYFEEVYGHDYEYHNSFTLEKKIASLLYLLTLPSAGLGFFVVFLVVSPGAVKLLQEDWEWCLRRVFGDAWLARFRRRLSSTYQEGDPLPSAVARLPRDILDREEGGAGGEGRISSHQSWYESNHSRSGGRGGGRGGRGRFDQLDEDELSSEITRMYSTSSSTGLRHYSLSVSYRSSGTEGGSGGERSTEPQLARGTLIAERLLAATDV
jgi:hypothetical protein